MGRHWRIQPLDKFPIHYLGGNIEARVNRPQPISSKEHMFHPLPECMSSTISELNFIGRRPELCYAKFKAERNRLFFFLSEKDSTGHTEHISQMIPPTCHAF